MRRGLEIHDMIFENDPVTNTCFSPYCKKIFIAEHCLKLVLNFLVYDVVLLQFFIVCVAQNISIVLACTSRSNITSVVLFARKACAHVSLLSLKCLLVIQNSVIKFMINFVLSPE